MKPTAWTLAGLIFASYMAGREGAVWWPAVTCFALTYVLDGINSMRGP